MRYAGTKIPWDWSAVTSEMVYTQKRKEKELSETDKRRKFIFGEDYQRGEYERVEQEIEEYNELFTY